MNDYILLVRYYHGSWSSHGFSGYELVCIYGDSIEDAVRRFAAATGQYGAFEVLDPGSLKKVTINLVAQTEVSP